MIRERVRQQFVNCFGIEPDQVTDDLEYATIPQWDSVAHMALVVALEDEFDIMMEIDDVIDMSTFKKATEIVARYI